MQYLIKIKYHNIQLAVHYNKLYKESETYKHITQTIANFQIPHMYIKTITKHVNTTHKSTSN